MTKDIPPDAADRAVAILAWQGEGRWGGDAVLVEIPLHFEAGDAKGIVRFNRDGQVAGLAIRPASP